MAEPTTAERASDQAPTGTLEAAFALAGQLLSRDPALALAQAREIQRAVPGHPQAVLIEGQALRRLGDLDGARKVLARLGETQPRSASTALELGLVLAEQGDHARAIPAFRHCLSLKADFAPAWHALATSLRALGHEGEANAADVRAIQASARDPFLLQAAVALGQEKFDVAEAMLRERLRVEPRDAAAMRMLGELRWRLGELDEATDLLERTLAIAPAFTAARELLTRILQMGPEVARALGHATVLLEHDPGNVGHALLKASLQVRLGEQEGAQAIYRKILAKEPRQPKVWLNLGHVEKTIGNQSEAIEAYRHAIEQSPGLGEGWWSLANLKTVKLDGADIAAMTAAIEAVPDNEQACQLQFALGKAYEDQGDAERAFAHYDAGNRLRRPEIDYDPDRFEARAREHAAIFTSAFLASRAGQGCQAADPVFVVGLPRSGSTLIEQILSSHSQVEGTMELPDLMMIADRLESRVEDGEFASYADLLAALAPGDLKRLGEEYLDRTQVHRKEGKPRFIDKMPNNWQHVGLIRLILPNATIIDARRHPMGCCFSGWKQYFARGQLFSYDLSDIGRYYRDYVGQMAAFDRAAPGAVHRVIYETMVADTEAQVRALLAHVGVPFEDGCLEFYRNRRAVRTASSEQVRQPIYTGGVDHWRQFDPWLGDLRAALGDIVEAYPEVPASL